MTNDEIRGLIETFERAAPDDIIFEASERVEPYTLPSNHWIDLSWLWVNPLTKEVYFDRKPIVVGDDWHVDLKATRPRQSNDYEAIVIEVKTVAATAAHKRKESLKESYLAVRTTSSDSSA